MILIYIILGLFVLLWDGGSLLWLFTSPEKREKIKYNTKIMLLSENYKNVNVNKKYFTVPFIPE